MHKHFAICAGALALMVLPACDSLEVADPNAPNAGDVSIQSLVSGTEGTMRTDMFVYLIASGTLSREVYNMDPADPRWVDELFAGPLDPGGFILLRPWSSRYRTIRNVLTLQERASADLSADQQTAVNGFAKTVIAHQLLLNLNYVGDNGIKIEFSGDINVPFASPEQAYAEIEQYLESGYSDLKGSGSAFPFDLTSGFEGFDTPATFAQFNRGVRARVAIYQKDYDAALAALSESFVDASGAMDHGVYHVYSAGAGDQLNPLFQAPAASFVKLRAHPMLKAMHTPGDQRYLAKILDRTDDAAFEPAPAAGNGLSSALAVSLVAGATSPLPLMRNEELLLIRAEAHIGKGDLASAEADLNQIRAAAGLDPLTLTAAGAIDLLLRERMYSLFLEGHRWVDLRRHDRLDSLPIDREGDKIFRQFPKPLDEVPEDG